MSAWDYKISRLRNIGETRLALILILTVGRIRKSKVMPKFTVVDGSASLADCLPPGEGKPWQNNVDCA